MNSMSMMRLVFDAFVFLKKKKMKKFIFVCLKTTIRDFKDMIKEKTDIPQDQQRIIFCGRVLNDEKRLKDFGKS